MCNAAFLLAALLFLQQFQYANASAGHVDPFRTSNYHAPKLSCRSLEVRSMRREGCTHYYADHDQQQSTCCALRAELFFSYNNTRLHVSVCMILPELDIMLWLAYAHATQ